MHAIMNLKKITGLSHATEQAFSRLADQALNSGIQLKIASGFRSIERQLAIWNRKSHPDYVFNVNGQEVATRDLSRKQWLKAVMQWSAVPGLSRHHWGTDIDVFDANALPKDYSLQLTPTEYSENGIFSSLHQFLNHHVDRNPQREFFRPYRSVTNGVSPEAWHLSYYPEAQSMMRSFTLSRAYQLVPFEHMYAGELVKEHFDYIYQHYVINVDD